ncbi:MAG: excinuclease ABC subunit UvrA [Myxococcota bacterium]
MRRTQIELRGVRTHNLKSIDVDVPLGRISVITGVSGSGKSSLAVDTLYAEGQRRFIESLSAYARQFLDRMARPDFERIDFLPPAIAIGQTSRPTSARASVGSMCQLADLLQLLYGAAAEPWCIRGHGPIEPASASLARAHLVRDFLGKDAVVVARVEASERSRAALSRDGYGRALAPDGSVVALDRALGATLDVVVDRLKIKDEPRLAEAVGAALALGRGSARVWIEGNAIPLSATLACQRCGFVAPPREARLFSPASPLGACEECQGFGRVQVIDPARVVPDPTRSLLRDAIAPWSTPAQAEWKEAYPRLAKRHGIDLKKPWQDLSEAHRTLIFEGDPSLDFSGVRGFFEYLEKKRYKVSSRILIARYRSYLGCPSCGGAKLKPGALSYRIQGETVAEVQSRSIRSLLEWARALAVDEAVRPLVERLLGRLEILDRIGLGYLTPNREGRTLSSGEARRVHLSSALGAGVTGTLYVLDEPSIGLHARDTERLGEVLGALAEAGNTVVLVEHDTALIRRADHVIELGPGAGKDGGRLVFAGPPSALEGSSTATGRALISEDVTVELPRTPRLGALAIKGAKARNLSGFDVSIPLGALTVITGVSGSGKSTFVQEVLTKNVERAQRGARLEDGSARAVLGADKIRAMVVVDTSPLARSARSIPATVLDAWTPIRSVLAQSGDAKRLGLGKEHFSFNAKGGRCETCEGLGFVSVDMVFLEDVTMECETCSGRRFSPRVLEARWRGLTVAEVLAKTVTEAIALFAEHRAVVRRLEPLAEVGLGYLSLGQTTSTLSGGEAQRLKLAAHLAEGRADGCLFILDEPTTGLHASDVEKLLGALAALLERGATLVVVEHNLELIRHAQHVIDLGPEGGAQGGQLVVEGTIFDLMGTPESRTGAALARYLHGSAQASARAGT